MSSSKNEASASAAAAPSLRVQALETQLEALTHQAGVLRVRLQEHEALLADERASAEAAAGEWSREIERMKREAETAREKTNKHNDEVAEKLLMMIKNGSKTFSESAADELNRVEGVPGQPNVRRFQDAAPPLPVQQQECE